MSATLTQRAETDDQNPVIAHCDNGESRHAASSRVPSTSSDVRGARIVLATYGSPGDVLPFLAIGRELLDRGQWPVVATSEMYRSMVQQAGIEFSPTRPDRVQHQKDPDFLQRLRNTPYSPAALFRDMFMPDLRHSTFDLIEATRGADGVVAHTLVAGGRLAAEFHGMPWVSAVMQPMGYLSTHEPPVIGPEWVSAMLRRAGAGATRNAFGVARSISAGWTREWHQLRCDLRLPESTEHPLWDGQHSPSRSLGLFPEVLGTPQADWPVTARVTGFPAYRPEHRTLRDELEEFLHAGEAPVVFTLGTTAVNDPGSFYEVGARAARDLGVRSVLMMGNGVDPRLRKFGPDVLAIDFAPHDMLFPRATAVVHQAGIGTLSEALLAGKPMLIMPYGHDQADNAWRAKRLGVAQVLQRRRFNAGEVRRALRELIEDAGVRASAARVQRVIARDEGARCAADHIVASLTGSTVRTRSN